MVTYWWRRGHAAIAEANTDLFHEKQLKLALEILAKLEAVEMAGPLTMEEYGRRQKAQQARATILGRRERLKAIRGVQTSQPSRPDTPIFYDDLLRALDKQCPTPGGHG